MKKKYVLLLGLITIANFIYGQKLMLNSIEETRTTTGSWDYCMVDVRLIGDEARNYSYYKINEITSATDNKGLNLISDNSKKYEYIGINESIRLELQKASRSATEIAISGTISLFKPTEANGGVVKVAGFAGKAGTNMAPKGSLFKLFYYDRANLEKRSAIAQETRMAEIDKLSGDEREAAMELEYLIQSIGYYTPQELDNSMMFIITGDSKSIIGLEFEEGNGKSLQSYSSSKTNMLYQYFFDTKPGPGTKLVLNLENPKSVKIVPFSLKNLDLP